MLTHYRRPVCLAWLSTDLPIWSTFHTAGTLYQKEPEVFHLLLHQPIPLNSTPQLSDTTEPQQKGLLWLEISPYRIIMTMQGNAKLGYRHFWEPGVYGLSRYWLSSEENGNHGTLRLRNFTNYLQLQGHPLPTRLEIEYELWSAQVQLGSYVLQLNIEN